MDQYKRVQSFVPEQFWYIYVAIERQEDNEDEVHTVEFKWKRNHLFGLEEAIVLYEKCASDLVARVLTVETKPTTKWWRVSPIAWVIAEIQRQEAAATHYRRIAAVRLQTAAHGAKEGARCES